MDVKAHHAAQGVRLADARKLDISFTLCSGRELKLSMHRGSHATYGAGLDLVTVVPEVPCHVASRQS
eukprot:2946657-Amphidinium_carterae.2